jgi:hypothetical protein
LGSIALSALLDPAMLQVAEVNDKFMKERAVRRRLHEQLQVLRGNIRVMCRCRPPLPPPLPGDTPSSPPMVVSFPLEGMLRVAPPDRPGRGAHEFEFDAVFGPDAAQEVAG